MRRARPLSSMPKNPCGATYGALESFQRARGVQTRIVLLDAEACTPVTRRPIGDRPGCGVDMESARRPTALGGSRRPSGTKASLPPRTHRTHRRRHRASRARAGHAFQHRFDEATERAEQSIKESVRKETAGMKETPADDLAAMR